MNRRRFGMASLAVMMANIKLMQNAKAQVQVISNDGQIVSTGDVVVRQSASGEQYVYNSTTGEWQQIVSNDLQVVSTGNVTVDQAASGTQVFQGDDGYAICSPGDYYEDAGCVVFCSEDGCSWVQFCCNQGCKKGRCGRG